MGAVIPSYTMNCQLLNIPYTKSLKIQTTWRGDAPCQFYCIDILEMQCTKYMSNQRLTKNSARKIKCCYNPNNSKWIPHLFR